MLVFHILWPLYFGWPLFDYIAVMVSGEVGVPRLRLITPVAVVTPTDCPILNRSRRVIKAFDGFLCCHLAVLNSSVV